MPLPFMKNKKSSVAGLIIKMRKPDESQEVDSEPKDQYNIDDCAKDLIQAVKMDDFRGVAMALEDAFNILDGASHKEEPHINKSEQEAE